MFKVILPVIVLLLLVALPGLAWWVSIQSLPVLDGIEVVPSLLKEVSIVSDDRGVPYIKASSDADLYRAQGYWSASRRLFQMDIMRRTARGELAEIYGAQCLTQDRLMRQIGLSRVAKEELKLLSPAVSKSIENYAAGVNDYIKDHGSVKKPLEMQVLGYEPTAWTKEDTLVVLKYIQYITEESWSLDELRQRILDKVGPEVSSRLFEERLAANPVEAPAGGTSATTQPATAAPAAPAGQTAPKAEAEKRTPKGSTSRKSLPRLRSLKGLTIGDSSPSAEVASRLAGQINSSPTLSSRLSLPVLSANANKGATGRNITGPSVAHSVPGYGSNGWVVSGTTSDTGGCLLALDRHSQLTDPNLWYACVLSTGDFKVAGVTIAGVPGILFGRNEKISWGAIALKADTQDLFVEEFSRQFPNKYKTVDGWAVSRDIDEYIRSKGSFSESSERHKVTVTRHGPVLLSSGTTAVVLSWSGYDITTPSIETYHRLMKAGSWEDFRGALKEYRGAPQSFIFADKKGNVGCQLAGNIPLRKPSALNTELSGSIIMPGWTGKCDWTGRMEFNNLSSIYNPENGYIVGNFTGLPSYRPPVTPYAVRRADAVLNSFKTSGRRAGLPEMAELQGDEYAPLSNLVRDVLRKAVEKQEVVDTFQLKALKLMNAWDGYLRRQSSSASIYESYIKTTARRILIPKLGPQLADEYMRRWPRWTVQVERFLTEKPAAWLPPETRSFDAFAVTTLGQALKALRIKEGSDDLNNLSWSKFHVLNAKNVYFTGQPAGENFLDKLMNPPRRGLGGDQDTLNALSVDIRPDNFQASVGPTERLLIDMSDDEKFYETQPLGQSGHLLSKNRTDQLEAWVLVQPLPIAFSDKQAERQQRHKVIYASKPLD